MNENAIDRKLVCAFIAELISDEGERKKGLEYIRNMPSVNPQPCEDAISRQAVIDMLDNAQILSVESGDYCGYCTEDIDIESIPPVTPQPKTGHWIVDRDDSRRWDKVRFYCSECGSWQTYGKTDYCPSCGAKMIEPQESEDKCKNCEYYRNPDYTRCKECGAERSGKE